MLLKPPSNIRGFTRMELLIVVFVIALLFILLAPEMAKRYGKSSKIHCSSQLKQIALSYKMFAGDNDEKFPWEIATESKDKKTDQPTWKYFLMVSNELGSTRLLMCPGDARRKTNEASVFWPVTNSNLPSLSSLQNNAVSYFLGIYSSQSLTNSILTGDRTMASPDSTKLYTSRGTIPVEVSTNSIWNSAPAEANHDGIGNYAMADGSVQQASTTRLQQALRLARDSYGTNANRFLFPQ